MVPYVNVVVAVTVMRVLFVLHVWNRGSVGRVTVE